MNFQLPDNLNFLITKVRFNFPGTLDFNIKYDEINQEVVFHDSVTDSRIVSVSELANLSNPDVINFKVADLDSFLKELFLDEPLWTKVMDQAAVDHEIGLYFQLATMFIKNADASEENAIILQTVWVKLLTRLFIYNNGNLATVAEADAWNNRVRRLHLPIWLEINIIA